MKTAEEYKGISIRYWIDFDRGNIDAKEYENRIESLFKQAQKDAYNEAWEHAIALRKRTGNPYNEKEGKAMLNFEIEARKLKK